MAVLKRSERYTRSRAALISGIVLAVIGTYTLIVGLISEPADPHLNLFDILFIIPAIVKLALAELQSKSLVAVSAAVLVLAVFLIVLGAVSMYRYRDDGAEMVPQTEAEIQRALDELERQYAAGEITREQYERKQQSVIWRR